MISQLRAGDPGADLVVGALAEVFVVTGNPGGAFSVEGCNVRGVVDLGRAVRRGVRVRGSEEGCNSDGSGELHDYCVYALVPGKLQEECFI